MLRSILFLALSLLTLGISSWVNPSRAAEPFTIGLLPDTQFYSEKFPDTYISQALWLREEYRAKRLNFVIGLGDIVQNPSEEKEWQNADKAAKILDGVVPYTIVPGNHDMVTTEVGLTRNTELYRKYFPPARYAAEPWYGGHMGDGNDNNFCRFEASGYKLLVISLEFCPSDESLAWAKQVIDQHPQHAVIIATHSYLGLKERDKLGPTAYKIAGNSGEQMWEKFIAKNSRIFLVVSGHFSGVQQQVSKNEAGLPVLEILTDYQSTGNGGDGWLRTMRFVPAENKIYIDAYSPLLKQKHEDPQHTLALPFDFSRLEVAASATK